RKVISVWRSYAATVTVGLGPQYCLSNTLCIGRRGSDGFTSCLCLLPFSVNATGFC
ncbi:hypothetical protein BaRGS_00020907, partial [Batillaria attramentaria]